MVSPISNHGFIQGLQDSPPTLRVSPRESVSTITGIIVDPHWSRRTFNIPDCPAKNTVGSLKEWYTRNICPTIQQSQLQIVSQVSGALIEDNTPFWQLAQGEGVFTISVLHTKPQPLNVITDSTVTLYVQHDTSGISTSVELPLKASMLQLKIAAFEQLGLGDAVAALCPNVVCTFQGLALDNESTLSSSQLAHGDHIYIGERRSPPVSRRASRTPSPTSGEDRNYQSIADIWSTDSSSSNNNDQLLCQECAPTVKRSNHNATCDPMPLFDALPKALFDDDKPASLPRRQRRNSKDGSRGVRKQQGDIEKMKLSYRTKMCRAGAHTCKFGHKCWFAHTPEELRKPTDPLPPQCPGVNKLEKYARRQDN